MPRLCINLDHVATLREARKVFASTPMGDWLKEADTAFDAREEAADWLERKEKGRKISRKSLDKDIKALEKDLAKMEVAEHQGMVRAAIGTLTGLRPLAR